MMESFFSRPMEDRNGITHVHRISTWDEIRRSGCDLEDFSRLFRNLDVVWLSRDAYVEHYHYSQMQGHPIHFHMVVQRDDYSWTSVTMSICSVTPGEPTQVIEELFQLVARKPAVASKSEVFLMKNPGLFANEGPTGHANFPISPQTLARLLDTGRSFKWMVFGEFFFSQEQCRVLSSCRGSLCFNDSSLADEGRLLLEELRRDRGVTGLGIGLGTRMDELFMRSALSNATSLRTLDVSYRPAESFDQLLSCLQRNRGLIELEIVFSERPVTDQEWSDIFAAIRMHPTLEKFKFSLLDSEQHEVTDAVRTERALVILETLRRGSKVIRQIEFKPANLVDRRVFDEQIQPHLTANVYRGRVKALVEERDPCIRKKVFSKALTYADVNHNQTAIFLFLSACHDILAESYVAQARGNNDEMVGAMKRPRSKLDFDENDEAKRSKSEERKG